MAEAAMSKIYMKIPVERTGVLIGESGGTKSEVEKGTGTKITVDGKSGEVVIEAEASRGDPSGILKARDIITAIGRGFSPQRAFRLFTDGQMIEVVDLKEAVGDSRNQLLRVKGRIIGENGKTRRIIEKLTGTAVSVYGHTVSVIGEYDEIIVAKEAISMLVKGAMHGAVYKYLNNAHLELKKKRLSLWEKRPELKEGLWKAGGGALQDTEEKEQTEGEVEGEE